MTDRELLEFAAKSAGFDFWPGNIYEEQGFLLSDGKTWWNPRDDDGDALRLAVQLRIGLHHGNDDDVMAVTYDLSAVFTEKFGNDPYAATRRAIVRAAAEIGGKL